MDGKGNGNMNSIGIEICVNSDGNFKQAVKNASELVKKIMEDEGIPSSRVVQHNNWSGKNCPTNLRNGSKGVNWSDFKGMLSGKSNATVSKPSTSKPGVSKPNTSTPSTVKAKGKLDVDGKWGQQLTAHLQKHYGTPQDGVLSGQFSNSTTEALYGGVEFGGGGSLVIKKLQADVGVTADGLLGPSTIKSLQKALNSGADGVISRPSSAVVKKMQKQLNDGTFNPKGKVSKPKPKPKAKANLKVDGKAGKSLVKAIQVATNSKYKDGKFSGQPRNSVTEAFYSGIGFGSNGSHSVKLLQKKVKAKADGKLGADTVRKLQKHLGTPQDGVISKPNSLVIRKLQEALNKGTF